MSYDIYLNDPVTKEVIVLDQKHQIIGGTYQAGGTTDLHLNITWNYGKHYYKYFGEKGIRTLYGMSGAESIPLLKDIISKLNNDVDSNYWKGTEGNAKQALCGLLSFAQMHPDGIWAGD